MHCIMFDLEFQGQGHNISVHFLEFPDISLVDIDTKVTFLSHRHQEILNNVQG